ncbi:hypothetical protein RDWZM_009832 [Blomia tropicalis]|uniref:Uncharacterized protein n=1 Tax=Blomia tropicalis TaxID=40697 RepID=A0A9Q0LY13_BLOTA|nr:hypothetical protein RDWZM_009832 [Blomia tropicalis]
MNFVPKKLPITTLPKEADVIEEFLYIKNDFQTNKNGKYSNNDIYKLLAKNIYNNWINKILDVNLVYNEAKVYRHVKTLFEGNKTNKGFLAIKKELNRKYQKNPEEFIKNEINNYIESTRSKLFDICVCKESYSLPKSKKCECNLCRSMNKEDYFFVHNSRHNKTAIESCLIDKNYQVLSTQVPIQQPTTSTAAIDHIIDDDDSSEIESISSEVEEATNVEKKYNTQMLTSLCIQTISTGCSIRKTTEIISSFILDMKLNNTIDLKPITKSKIESGLKRVRKISKTFHLNKLISEPFLALLFDSKRDDQLKFIKSSQNTFSRTNVKEEHYTLVKQPGDIFVSSVSSKNQVF